MPADPIASPGLSVVIPVFNERETLGALLVAVGAALPGVTKELLIVDDCSTDGTRDWLRRNLPDDRAKAAGLALSPIGDLQFTPGSELVIRVLYHKQNLGKGGAVRSGFAAISGKIAVIQDADLEYDPQDWGRMHGLIADRQVADVVYGSRFYGAPHRSLYYHHYLANRLISVIFNLLYNQTLTDIEVCYKMMRREVVESLSLTANDFGIEIEMSAQIARARRWRIYEMGISYYGRTYAEGKKIGWRDGVKALWYLVKYRF